MKGISGERQALRRGGERLEHKEHRLRFRRERRCIAKGHATSLALLERTPRSHDRLQLTVQRGMPAGEMTLAQPSLPPRLALRLLSDLVERGDTKDDDTLVSFPEPFDEWFSEARRLLERAFGKASPEFLEFQHFDSHVNEAEIMLTEGFEEKRTIRLGYLNEARFKLRSYMRLLAALDEHEPQPEKAGHLIFIGHGRSQAWRDLKDFLKERVQLPVDEFNRMPVAGKTTIARLEEMLDSARFAFLVMTAEDEDSEGKARARQNVVHEVGLFQGRLGFKKAIVLLEEGCEEFSNITGLSQLRFPKNNIAVLFEEVRRVLEREGLIPGTGAAF